MCKSDELFLFPKLFRSKSFQLYTVNCVIFTSDLETQVHVMVYVTFTSDLETEGHVMVYVTFVNSACIRPNAMNLFIS